MNNTLQLAPWSIEMTVTSAVWETMDNATWIGYIETITPLRWEPAYK